jgi:hypothetical protein
MKRSRPHSTTVPVVDIGGSQNNLYSALRSADEPQAYERTTSQVLPEIENQKEHS